MNTAKTIAGILQLNPVQVATVTELLDAGNTLPFIARYRKEMTGNLDEEQLRQIASNLEKQHNLERRRTAILQAIETQGKLTPSLQKQLKQAATLTALEDLYHPYKGKRRTRATAARDKGLQPLADQILAQPRNFNMQKVTADELAGARDIVAEVISENAGIRGQIRAKALQWAVLQSRQVKNSEDTRQVFKLYYEANFRIDRLRPHQILALNRGQSEKILRVKVNIAERDWQPIIRRQHHPDHHSPLAEQLELALEDGGKRLLLPAIERDVRRALTETAEQHAITVFAANLRNLLTQPPLANHVILGIDPGFRSGCKVAVVDTTGDILAATTIFPHAPQRRWQAALKVLNQLVKRHTVTLIAIGNGTASQESEILAAELIEQVESSRLRQAQSSLQYLIVSEAGASVYSASRLARMEMPHLDVTLRGAVSIARRVQDPLAELVKIEPKAIGVGMYQHDVNQKALDNALAGVVEGVVNQVGVDVNMASPALLAHIAGIGPKVAQNIVAYRQQNGPYKNRMALNKVKGVGAKAFEQAAGFLRVQAGDNPLDASAIHPESYELAKRVLQKVGLQADAPLNQKEMVLSAWQKQEKVKTLALELNAGILTLTDILEQLLRPGRDPREDLPLPVLRQDVLSLADLNAGMILTGTVRNVVDFGAFVDIGVKQSGLLHRSQMPRGVVLGVGDIIKIVIQQVEAERGRISLGWSA